MRDLTRTPVDLPSEHQLVIAGLDPAIHPSENLRRKMDARVQPWHDNSSAGDPTSRDALPRTPRTLHASTAARWRGWSVSRQARRRNLRLMLLLIDAAPLSRQA